MSSTGRGRRRRVPDRLRWLGHSTVLIELDGARLLTDPLLRGRVLHLRRAAPLVDEPLDRLDAVLVSHLHYDHLDPPSLRRLDRAVTVVVPKGAGKVVRGSGFANVEEVAAGETVEVGASHRARRPRRARLEPRARGEVGGARLRRRGRRPARLLPRRHRPLPRDGRPGLRPRRRAHAHLGLGAVAGPGAPGPAPRRRGARAPAAADRGAHPLGHVLPGAGDTPPAARVPAGAGVGVRAPRGRAGAGRRGARARGRRRARLG